MGATLHIANDYVSVNNLTSIYSFIDYWDISVDESLDCREKLWMKNICTMMDFSIESGVPLKPIEIFKVTLLSVETYL